jgi:hypothetical protein
MKKLFAVLVLAAVFTGGVFAQAEYPDPNTDAGANVQGAAAVPAGAGRITHKHSAGDMLLGLNFGFFGVMMNANPLSAFSSVTDSLRLETEEAGPGNFNVNASIDLPKFFATARILNLGLSFEYYIFHWLTAGTGLWFGPEVNVATSGGTSSISVNAATTEAEAKQKAVTEISEVIHVQAGLFLTIPFNVHFNIPKVEWLYSGLGVEIHIPVSDAGLSSFLGSEVADIISYLPGGGIAGKTFISMPIDIGFDFSRVKANGRAARSRLFFRIEPEFFGNGLMSLPVSLIWQCSLWKLANVAIPGTN